MEKTITVINPLGLHARPAAKVVDCAARFTSDIRISYQSQEIDAKSIMSAVSYTHLTLPTNREV